MGARWMRPSSTPLLLFLRYRAVFFFFALSFFFSFFFSSFPPQSPPLRHHEEFFCHLVALVRAAGRTESSSQGGACQSRIRLIPIHATGCVRESDYLK
ncbi:hypothetical protein B0T19DRAFT_98727 [Cercophora scortea]|uniref:Uncharacterized protein n=1 Tax=Cercophora scortea TaxID=314031 RepID=A0AAE0IVX1_9PEZI|nr:hypothetical protein B0T19DRAFT_98727 [Cercophora scortea]